MSWLYLEQLRRYSEQMLRRHAEEADKAQRERTPAPPTPPRTSQQPASRPRIRFK